jgi:UDP-glucose 4-epimerase
VTDAVVSALDKSVLSRRVFNIGPGRMQSLDEIVAGIREVLPDAKVELHDDGLGWNTFGIGPMMIDEARNHLGFVPRTDFASGARQTLLWLQQRNAA